MMVSRTDGSMAREWPDGSRASCYGMKHICLWRSTSTSSYSIPHTCRGKIVFHIKQMIYIGGASNPILIFYPNIVLGGKDTMVPNNFNNDGAISDAVANNFNNAVLGLGSHRELLLGRWVIVKWGCCSRMRDDVCTGRECASKKGVARASRVQWASESLDGKLYFVEFKAAWGHCHQTDNNRFLPSHQISYTYKISRSPSACHLIRVIRVIRVIRAIRVLQSTAPRHS